LGKGPEIMTIFDDTPSVKDLDTEPFNPNTPVFAYLPNVGKLTHRPIFLNRRDIVEIACFHNHSYCI
jgi:hypothetical protein